ncbi:MAG: type II secretion system F family protein [Chloroflexi bacterium]|nr:type II secretion system F family protein [Chloroflexota bacterium]
MTAALALGGALGCGLLLLVTAQPLGRPRPELSLRLGRLSAEGRLALEGQAGAPGAPMFSSPLLERTLRPVLEDAGRLLGTLLARAGIELGDLEQRLALGVPRMTAPQFRGQQLATAAVSGLALPAMNVLGVHPLGPWPVWLWLAAAGCGFAAPGWQLSSRLGRRRRAILEEIPVALDLFVIAASAGLSPEQALVEASRRLEGVLGQALRDVVREAGLGTAPGDEGIARLAEREDIPELRSLAGAWQLAHRQGLPLAPALLSLAETVRDRRRAQLVEAGGRASVRMLFPVALFIFPVFLVVLLYPAGVELLGLGG